MKKTLLLIAVLGAVVACSSKQPTEHEAPKNAQWRADFNADSAYAFVAKQISFGPRVPGTDAHQSCALWLVEKLSSLGADTVEIVGSETTTFDGTALKVKNIRARFNGTEALRPVLLAAHYDSRPWADADPDPARRTASFDAANDGASGVAVILEIARCLGTQPARVPVEILLTDIEDYGSSDVEGSWCIGSQQFAGNLPYDTFEMPRFGILLDMVGGRDARFPKEYFSTQIAPYVVAKIWGTAANLGLSNRFTSSTGGAITDDHLPLTAAGIPTANIIESNHPMTGSFPPTWHTSADNINAIDRTTLRDVGLVVINVINNEK